MTGFVHQALRYGSDAEFLAGTADFVADGLEADDAVLAVVSDHNAALLREALGSRSRQVEFAFVRDWYDYPSRALGRCHAYCERHGSDRRVRVVGEPVRTGRTDFETREWMRYESLLNVAFADTGHWILCPYDTRVLSAEVVAGAARTHPELARDAHSSAPSAEYTNLSDCQGDRPVCLPPGPDDIPFARGGSAAVRRALTAYARRLGMPEPRTHDIVAAVHEAVANAVRYGGGRGVVRLRSDPDHVICEISDSGTHAVPLRLPGHLPPRPRAAGGHGMWLVRQLSDLVAAEFGPSGSVLQLWFSRPPAA